MAEAALPAVQNGARCRVIGGVHRGKAGTIADRKLSRTGEVTVTVRLPDGDRVKTLGRNVEILADESWVRCR
jgi:ribosomal protein S4E